MKSLLLSFLLLASILCNAQNNDEQSSSSKTLLSTINYLPAKVKTKEWFTSFSTDYSSTNDLTFSGEVGLWGTTSPTSYSFVFDISRNTQTPQGYDYYVGIKPYVSLFTIKSIFFQAYASPKVKLNNDHAFLIEYGLGANQELNKHFIFSYDLYFQNMSGYYPSSGLCISIIYLFTKN